MRVATRRLMTLQVTVLILSGCATAHAVTSTPSPAVTAASPAPPSITVAPAHSATDTPAACPSAGTKDSLKLLSLDPPLGRKMRIGEVYYLTAHVQVQLNTWPRAYLQFLIYEFKNGFETLDVMNIVQVQRGCSIREIDLEVPAIHDVGETAMKPMLILRWDNGTVVSDKTLLTPFNFLGSYPVSH